ncbi:hypothetical protein GYMLUDRAFT_1029192 [Collybiopsis luxurians FD-317 M1]|uniref:Uncharacterized protein n=1 Tax=Collybiopsis luxurians FD-317 M1 TaxID=944289 RepID=A0A0D0C348_9AGAR|nr:hypothetical protein GYMLUDRAFT_1029192 [Collybiopsis luxurians FD-317 M1]
MDTNETEGTASVPTLDIANSSSSTSTTNAPISTVGINASSTSTTCTPNATTDINKSADTTTSATQTHQVSSIGASANTPQTLSNPNTPAETTTRGTTIKTPHVNALAAEPCTATTATTETEPHTAAAATTETEPYTAATATETETPHINALATEPRSATTTTETHSVSSAKSPENSANTPADVDSMTNDNPTERTILTSGSSTVHHKIHFRVGHVVPCTVETPAREMFTSNLAPKLDTQRPKPKSKPSSRIELMKMDDSGPVSPRNIFAVIYLQDHTPTKNEFGSVFKSISDEEKSKPHTKSRLYKTSNKIGDLRERILKDAVASTSGVTPTPTPTTASSSNNTLQ